MSPRFPPRTRSGKAILSATVHCHCARGLVARPWDARLWARRGRGHPGKAAVRIMAGLEEASLPPFFLVSSSVSWRAWVRGGGMWSCPPLATVCATVIPRPSQHPQEGPGRDWEQQTRAVGLAWSVPSALGRTCESRPTGRASTRLAGGPRSLPTASVGTGLTLPQRWYFIFPFDENCHFSM